MSLINQALRKAQRDRTPTRIQDVGSTPSHSATAVAGSGLKPGLIIGLVVALAMLLGLVVGLSVIVFRGDSAPGAQTSAPLSPAQTPAGESPLPTTPPASQAAAPTQPISPQQLALKEASPLEREALPPVIEELRKAREAAESKAATEARAAEEAAKEAEAAAVKPSQEIIQWLTNARVSGVKISNTDSKVILNGKPYGIGEYVNFNLGLKVMIIQEKRILFVDDKGKKYLKQL
ncbi:MAG: hypothetical protein ACPGSB_00585 [Opitutales bacterium]